MKIIIKSSVAARPEKIKLLNLDPRLDNQLGTANRRQGQYEPCGCLTECFFWSQGRPWTENLDIHPSKLNGPSKLKRHLSEKMSFIYWPESVPHISGKVVNFNTCIIFFLVPFAPNDPLYDSESGAWSWVVSKASSHAYLNSTGPPSCTGYRRFGCAELCSAPDVRDDSIQRLVTP